MDTALQDLRHGVRQLLRQPISSTVAILTLTLGISLSTALFSIVYATIFRPLPYPNPEQLITIHIEERNPDGSSVRLTPSMEDMRTWQAVDDVFSNLAGWGHIFRGRILSGPSPQRVEVRQFTEWYLALYGVTPSLGRGFSRADTRHGAPVVALLGYGFWQREFGGRPDVLDTTLRLDNEVATVIGVLPASFHPDTQLAVPLRIEPDEFSRRGTGRVQVDARLRPGISIEEAQARLVGGEGVQPVINSQLELFISRYQLSVTVFSLAVALLVLLACVNVTGLLLARGSVREREFALRASLGANRRRLLLQVLSETLILTLASGGLSVVLASASLDAIVANLPFTLPANSAAAINGTVLGLTLLLLMAVAILSGLWPALRLSRPRVDALMLQASPARSALSRRAGQCLIAAEVMVAVVLLAGAGLMLRSVQRIDAVDLGFEPEGLVTMQVQPLDSSPAAHQVYYNTVLQQLRAVPNISSAAAVDSFVLGGGATYTLVSTSTKEIPSAVFEATPDYLGTIQARVLGGRLPHEQDYAAGSALVVINESAARTLFPTESAVGRNLMRTGDAASWSISGVVADIRHGGPLSTRSIGQPQVFFPFEPTDANLHRPMTIVVRTSGHPLGVLEQMRRIAHSSGPRAVLERIQTAETLFDEEVLAPRKRAVLLGLVGAFGLLLAVAGVFATTAFAVVRRTREIGVRIAIGARPGQVVGMLVLDAALPLTAGVAAGLGGAWMSTRMIDSFLFQTSPTDPSTLAGVAGIVMISGLLAATIPAAIAATMEPTRTLRAE